VTPVAPDVASTAPIARAPLPGGTDAGSNATLVKLMSKPGTAKLVERFLAGLGQRVAAIRDALSASEMNQLKVLAHQLKGAAGGYGFAAISQASAKLESAIVTGADSTTISAAVSALAATCAQVRGVAA